MGGDIFISQRLITRSTFVWCDFFTEKMVFLQIT